MKKNKLAMLAAVVMLALSMLACSLGGSKATEVPPTAVPPTAVPPTAVPPTAVPPTAAPTTPPSSNAPDLEIIDPHFYQNDWGDYHIIGLVKNNTNRAKSSIELSLEVRDAGGASILKDSDGKITESTTIYPLLDNLFPGQTSPFDYYLSKDDGTPATVKVEATGSLSSSEEQSDVVVENVELFMGDPGEYYISGELVNKSSSGSKVDSLAGAVLDDQGKMVAADWSVTYAYYLAPNGDAGGMDRSPFVISIDGPTDADYSGFATYVDGIVTDEIPIQEIYVTLTYDYFDEWGDFHVVGTLENGSNVKYSTYLVTGLYDENGVVLDAASSSLPMYLDPGAVIPFDATYFSSVGWNDAQAERVDNYTTQIDPYWTYEAAYETVMMTSYTVSDVRDDSNWTFTGEVTNDSGKALSWIVVLVAVYNGDTLVGTDYYSIYPDGDEFAAGSKASFEVSADLDPGLNDSTLTYELMVQGAVK